MKRPTRSNTKYFDIIPKPESHDIVTDRIFKLLKVKLDIIDQRTKYVQKYRELHKKIINMTLRVKHIDNKIMDKVREYNTSK